MNELFADAGITLAAVATVGGLYTLFASALVGRFMRRETPDQALSPAVTILKPLHLGDPDLERNLETFFSQTYAGPVQIVFGVHDEADSALDVVRRLQAKYPQCDTAIVADRARYGANAKVSNLINMFPLAKHDVLVLSDSDISAGRQWLTQVTAALSRPGVGIVTCLYTGETGQGGNKLWSSLGAMGSSYDFLPNVILGTSLGLAQPCMGSTIALRRETLDEVGGFNTFANRLADDYEMGAAVRAKGYTLAIPALGVGHTAAENSLSELYRHELRWVRTIRMVNRGGHLGSFVTHGFAFALIAAMLLDFNSVSMGVLGFTLGARLFLKYRIDGLFGINPGPYWMVPVRDLLTFVVFVASLFGETVHWRGSHFAVEASGAMSQV